MNRYVGVVPFPARLNRLGELAVDLWWTWNHEGRMVFRSLDYRLWRETAHNPVKMLWMISPDRLAAAAADPKFLQLYDSAISAFDSARSTTDTWWSNRYPHLSGQSVAYFSAEFALHQSLPIYAGGLGVLAGDHCKEASDLGVPLIGVGFMYPQGYFHQHVTSDGWQEESYERLKWAEVAIEQATTADGRPCITAVPRSIPRKSSRPTRVRLPPCSAQSSSGCPMASSWRSTSARTTTRPTRTSSWNGSTASS